MAVVLVVLVVVNAAVTGWLVSHVRTVRKVQSMHAGLLKELARSQRKLVHESDLTDLAED